MTKLWESHFKVINNCKNCTDLYKFKCLLDFLDKIIREVIWIPENSVIPYLMDKYGDLTDAVYMVLFDTLYQGYMLVNYKELYNEASFRLCDNELQFPMEGLSLN